MTDRTTTARSRRSARLAIGFLLLTIVALVDTAIARRELDRISATLDRVEAVRAEERAELERLRRLLARVVVSPRLPRAGAGTP